MIKNVGCNLSFHEDFLLDRLVFLAFFPHDSCFETLFVFFFSGFTSCWWTISCYHINKSCPYLGILYDFFFFFACLYHMKLFLVFILSKDACWIESLFFETIFLAMGYSTKTVNRNGWSWEICGSRNCCNPLALLHRQWGFSVIK